MQYDIDVGYVVLSDLMKEALKQGKDQYRPNYKREGDAGFDLRACIPETIVVEPYQQVEIPCGFGFDFLKHRAMLMAVPRSGMGKLGLVLANTTGIIDKTYQGQTMLEVLNRTDKPITVNPFDRIMQAVFVPVLTANFGEQSEFSEQTERGDKGFNSTGVE